MKINDFLDLSLRALVTKTSRTLLTVLGMGVGIGAVLFLVSLGFGLRNVLIEEITTDKSFVILDVTAKDTESIQLSDDIFAEINMIPEVRGVSPVKDLSAQAQFDSLKSEVQIKLVDENFLQLSGLDAAITKGRPYKNNEMQSIVISGTLAQLFDDNGVSPLGKSVQVEILIDGSIQAYDFKVIGILGESLQNTIYVHRNTISVNSGKYSLLKVETKTSDVLQEVRELIVSKGFNVSSISDTVEQANQIFGVITTVLAVFGIIALTVSAIGMFNTMTITLLERTSEIGVMKSIGASRIDVIKLFVAEAIIMGLLGSIAGVIIGMGFSEIINIGFNTLASRFGGEPVDIFYTPPQFILFIILFGSIIGLITGVIPARRASNIDALEALRYK